MIKKWYLLQFKSNSHNKAIKNLNQQGFETFLPLHTATERRNSQFIDITRPLFPGYMFVAFDSKNIQWTKINNTFGVVRLITFNSALQPIPITYINQLKNRCDISGRLIDKKTLNKGDQVKVLKGPFTKFIATVETYETDNRIFILMDLMGRKTKIQARANDLQLSS